MIIQLLMVALLVSASVIGYAQPQWRHASGARIIYSTQQAVNNYHLALAPYQKILGQWQAKTPERYSGSLTQLTLELPKTMSAQVGLAFYQSQLKSSQTRTLYECALRVCGPSQVWAQEHFKQPLLKGLDNNQFYYTAVWQKTSSTPEYWVTLYASGSVSQSNKLQIDVFAPKRSTPAKAISQAAILAQWDQGLSFTVAHTELTQTEWVQLRSAIKQLPSHQKVAIVVHDYSRTTQAKRLAFSEQLAFNLKQQLVRAGVKSNRISAQGIGGLAPDKHKPYTTRIEWVLTQ